MCPTKLIAPQMESGSPTSWSWEMMLEIAESSADAALVWTRTDSATTPPGNCLHTAGFLRTNYCIYQIVPVHSCLMSVTRIHREIVTGDFLECADFDCQVPGSDCENRCLLDIYTVEFLKNCARFLSK